MNDELNFTMEKKVLARQSPCASKNNGAVGEKKNDYLSSKNGRQKKHRDTSSGSKSQDVVQQTPRPTQKYSRIIGDKRPRQRGYSDYRQSEEIAEPFVDMDPDLMKSRKVRNANHLLNFSYQGYHSNYGGGARGAVSWGGRKAYRHQVPTYKKEQYLQASCQFVAHEDGDYSQQAIDPDALVDWDSVQLVRTFSSEVVICPICLDVPIAAKITRCGHTYCWGCILHYLQVNNSPKHDTICPVCPDNIVAGMLKSVQNVVVPDYKVGDEIEMKLMRKSKGSIFVYPEEEWIGNEGGHLNIDAGNRTKFSKLLMASWNQIQVQVIEQEKEALSRGLRDADEDEVCFLQMAQHMLECRETSLKNQIGKIPLKKDKPMIEEPQFESMQSFLDEPCDGSKVINYADAFEDEIEPVDEELATSAAAGPDPPQLFEGTFDLMAISDTLQGIEVNSTGDGGSKKIKADEREGLSGDSASISKTVSDPNSGSPITDIHKTLTPDEAADHLELPELSGSPALNQHRMSGPKDTYHFYQASTGQHIYMHTLNAQCLDMQYKGLENAPRTITASIVAVERIFMSEEMRKRLRYLNHIPLTTEFHVVELKLKPPIVSKETLKSFQSDFDKRRKMRQRKAKDEKMRANKNEVEHKKAHGIYVAPEIHIPLDNTAHFPSHLASSPGAIGRQRRESANSDIFPDTGDNDGNLSPGSPRCRDGTESNPSFVSFAQKLQGQVISGENMGSSPPAWPMVNSCLPHSATMPNMRNGSSLWEAPRHSFEHASAIDDGEAYQAPSMASSWMSSLHDLTPEPLVLTEADKDGDSSIKGKKKKKKKEKQLLFSTSMARKN